MSASIKHYALIGAACIVALAAFAIYFYSTHTADNAAALTSQANALTAASSGKSASLAASSSNGKRVYEKPLWSDLTQLQQRALGPLVQEWNSLDGAHKAKWLQLSEKFAMMTPAQQERFHERMRDWVTLTPEQRRQVRENFWRAKALAPDQKSAQWEQYQQLPEDQKKKLAADNASKKQVATLPSALPSSAAKSKSAPVIVKPKTGMAATKPHIIPLSPLPAATGLVPVVVPSMAPAANSAPAPAANATPAPAPAAGSAPPAAPTVK